MVAEAEVIGDGKVEFKNLPEDCISNVLSFTTPRDVCALSLVSTTFRSAAQSDVVWERFLPSDYRTIIPTSLSFPSKKDLYLHLTQKPILIDNGQKSLMLDKLFGKKCYMLSARTLSIVWGDTPCYWKWTSSPDSRFSEVAYLVSVCWLEIRGRITTCMLSPEMLYGAYLVFKPSAGGSHGFQNQPVEVSVGIVGEADNTRTRTLYLDVPSPRRPRFRFAPLPAIIFQGTRLRGRRLRVVANHEAEAEGEGEGEVEAAPPARFGVEYPKERVDGWWEIELGDLFNKGGEDKEVEMAVYDINSGNWKGGIFIQGIEIRPKLDHGNP